MGDIFHLLKAGQGGFKKKAFRCMNSINKVKVLFRLVSMKSVKSDFHKLSKTLSHSSLLLLRAEVKYFSSKIVEG